MRSLLTPLLCGLLLAACATTSPVPQQLAGETDDLAMVSADALALASELGAGRVLVVYDIDNTLLAMPQGLGADQWYEWQKQLADADACDPRIAGPRLAVQGALYFASAMRPTQPDAAEQVRRVQQAGVPALVVTARGADFRLSTFRELRRNGYSFAFDSPGPPGGLREAWTPVGLDRPLRYEDGVLMTAGQHKGAALADLLARTGTPLPEVVVMADDKPDNLAAVVETFTAVGVPVHAWRYSGEDAEVAAFDPLAAADLWAQLEPALVALQDLLGPNHYELPSVPEPCKPLP